MTTVWAIESLSPDAVADLLRQGVVPTAILDPGIDVMTVVPAE